MVGLAAAATTCMVGGAGGGLPLAAGHEDNGSAGCAEQRTGRAVCVGVGQQQPALFAGVHGDLRGSGYCSRDRSEEHPPRCGAWGTDRNCYLAVNSHPGLVDLFLSQTRKAYAQEQQKTSVRDKLKKLPETTSPKISAKSKDPER